MQLIRLRNAVVVNILPQSKAPKNGVLTVDLSVTISAIFGLVKFSQRVKTVFPLAGGRIRLWRTAAKQLRTTIYCTVAVSVQRQPRIIAASRRPGNTLGRPVCGQIECNSTFRIGKIETIPQCVYDYRRFRAKPVKKLPGTRLTLTRITIAPFAATFAVAKARISVCLARWRRITFAY